MRKTIEGLLHRYKTFGIYREKEKAVFRYTDKYNKDTDGTVNIITAMQNGSEEYPNELVECGFGHGSKYKKAGTAEEHIFTTSIDSEVEESEESENNEMDNENEEMDNDYMENYYDNDEQETDDNEEDVI
ncbi:hypothetical protein NEPAR06_1749 [Nematocida parisii]|uniref:Uncharacterized protein n=1 Tax=Nematocida parisii (strain ERTm3) TaxID=935791 RepID=I3EFK2_NEMP3|nr:uncharacterized protein NEPG_02171 [Nematocida parisii ERTm1]EIJ87999.1 hypothetical protein NEQG_02071 [Nematocida parisii ERTm3]KAI5130516.1 hypothetical protein NEPAR03_2104 [Nematocida parisii]EIJ93215.1 hypothetical protein NEPG_02171 [Nematocida parisii ERTm1]KAI5130622.1 hypothetical protein NEPAR08_2131 [Nematocida parisii]KAI5144559.1 hypothetical protein NEPAR04_2148 [Nematocida parisii]|eukprot:XP_013059998.1 hypothetical protein NEPG_02171 [Nematocida parisii ERTm1]